MVGSRVGPALPKAQLRGSQIPRRVPREAEEQVCGSAVVVRVVLIEAAVDGHREGQIVPLLADVNLSLIFAITLGTLPEAGSDAARHCHGGHCGEPR